jgi:hypothetical protein
MPSNYLLETERMVRAVPWAKLAKNEDETVVYGPSPAAFALRDDETYLSATWCEYFSGSGDEALRCAVEALKSSKYKMGRKGRFAVANVGEVKELLGSKGHKIRVVHEREDDNPAHVAIRQWPKDDVLILDRLAQEVWALCYDHAQADALPPSPCTRSTRAG